MEIVEELNRRAQEFEVKLKELYSPSGVCKKLDESIAYTVFSGGKRLRPLLTLACYEIFGGKPCESIIEVACSVELLHNYTLIHDDMPCMDNDDFRRGRPTNHKVFGEATALLAGDALLSLSHEFLYDAIAKADNKSLYLTASKLIAEFTGPSGTVGGQALEFEFDDSEYSISRLLEIINGKTCKLISAACLAGAIAAGADEKKIMALAKYSQSLGYAFQLSDDLLDCEKAESDEKSLVNICGKEYTQTLLDGFITNALKNLEALDEDTEFLAEVVKYCAVRKK